jgi:hypothetical protein
LRHQPGSHPVAGAGGFCVHMLQQQRDGLPQQLEQVLTEVQQKPSST